MNQIQKLTNEIIGFGKLIIITATMIYIVYNIIKALIGDLPATISGVIIGLGSLFIYATNKKVRDSINSWLKKKK